MADGGENKETRLLSENATPEKEDNVSSSIEASRKDEGDTEHLLKPSKKEEIEALQQDKTDSFKIPLPTSTPKESKEKEPETKKEYETKKEKVPELPYKIPWWSATPPQSDDYNLEILKNGCIVSTIDLNDKACHVFGRLPLCDVVLEHPSISRYHAVIQYRGDTDGDKSLSGFYLYDLGSTHGTLVNKAQIRAKTFYRLKIGYVIKFGGSSRLFVLQGPLNDGDDEMTEEPTAADATSENTTIKSGQIFTDEEYNSLKKVEKKTEQSSEGIDWGFGEDAEEEHIDSEKFAELYSGVEFKDPKKTLRGYYEREGLELEYIVDETGPGHARVYHCKVRLPVDGPNGSAVYADASVTGRKKEAVRECANEACKMLDAYGLLRQSNHESRKKRERNWEEDDFYESDEDNFLDRTGTVETKRLKRMRKAGKEKTEVETYDSLLEKLQKVQEERKKLEKQISDQEGLEGTEEGDSLDHFMSTISHSMDKQTKIKLKRRIVELRKDEKSIEKLVSLAKPTNLPSLQTVNAEMDGDTTKQDNQEDISKKNQDSPTKTEEKSEKECKVDKMKKEDEPSSKRPEEKMHLNETTKTTLTSKPFTEFAMPSAAVKHVKSKNVSKTSENEGDMKRKVVMDNGHQQYVKDIGKNDEKSKETSGSKPNEDKRNEDKRKEEQVVKKKRYTAPTQWEDASNPDFANWVPPEDQSGDGRTKLNDKYGY